MEPGTIIMGLAGLLLIGEAMKFRLPPEVEEEVEAEVAKQMAKVRAIYGGIPDARIRRDPEVTFDLDERRVWARSSVKEWRIRFNPEKVAQNKAHVLAHTVKAEVAHLVARLIRPEGPGHDQYWRDVLVQLGGNPADHGHGGGDTH